MWQKVSKDIFSEESENKTMHIKKIKLLILIADSCLSTLFAMYKRVLNIKCKIPNFSSDKDLCQINVKKFHKMMKILSNICFSGNLFTLFVLKDTLPFVCSSLRGSYWLLTSCSWHFTLKWNWNDSQNFETKICAKGNQFHVWYIEKPILLPLDSLR